ncbi:MAG TPA: hypothetical protein VNB94_02045 [Mycobacteriales bacterium]|nr:hypothetical protein [Mycobacteriales bacterium]
MNVRRLALIVAMGGACAAALPAGAAPPKSQTETYTVTAPVPFPVTASVPTFDGCWQGQETLTKNTKPLTFAAEGTITAELTYMGDWDLYLFDSKGGKAAASETFEESNATVLPGKEKFTFKKIKPGAKYTLVVCNWLGQREAKVTYTFVPKSK